MVIDENFTYRWYDLGGWGGNTGNNIAMLNFVVTLEAGTFVAVAIKVYFILIE